MLTTVSNFFRKLSASERRLAVITVVVLVVAVVVVLGIRGMRAINALDERIASFQHDLVYCTQQTVQADSVNKAFEAIASQHSSKWTQEEIHDRLRREITRLSLRKLLPPGSEAAPSGAGSMLVDIRSMPAGSLEDSGEGYRSYTISFRTEPAPATDVATFLERLQRSDQVLRIDTIDMTRQPASNLVTASIKVTRTVIGEGPKENASASANSPTSSSPSSFADQPSSNLSRNGNFEKWDAQANRFPEWAARGCRVSVSKSPIDGAACQRAEAVAANANIYQGLDLQAGKSYDLTADISAKGHGQLQVVDGKTEAPFPSAVPLVPDGAIYRYHVRFTIPSAPTGPVPIRVPYIVLEEKGAVVQLGNVILREAED